MHPRCPLRLPSEFRGGLLTRESLQNCFNLFTSYYFIVIMREPSRRVPVINFNLHSVTLSSIFNARAKVRRGKKVGAELALFLLYSSISARARTRRALA